MDNFSWTIIGWFMFELISTMIDSSLFIFLIHRKISQRQPRWWIDVPFILSLTLLLNMLNGQIPYAPFMVIAWMLLTAYGFIYKQGPLLPRIFWPSVAVFVYVVVNLIIQGIVSIMPHLTFADFMGHTPLRIQLVSLYALMVTTVFWFLARKRVSQGHLTHLLQLVVLVIFLLATAVSGLMMDAAPLLKELSGVFAIISVALLLLTAGLFVFIDRLGQKTEETIILQQRVLQNQMEQSHYEHINSLYDAMKGWRHDFHNHIEISRVLLKENNYDELERYMDTLSDDFAPMYTLTDTGIIVLDAIISSKIIIARQSGIPVELSSIGQLDGLKLQGTELCTMVGNLLDNAIEAVLKLPEHERWVKMSSVINGGMWNLNIINASDGVYQTLSDTLRSSKRQEGHGLGIRRVCELVKEAGGDCDFRPLNDRFEVSVMIPLAT